jgi:predicted membrane-bound spermidine synthase
VTVDRAPTPDGAELTLLRRGDEWIIKVDRELLMSNRMHHSEEMLAIMALERAPHCRSLLVGGLGLGFTLRAALDRLPPHARVTVAELSPQLVAWNRGPLAPLAGRPLYDPRVRVAPGDVYARIAAARGAWDVILLDVDNGPRALCLPGNDRLYGDRGIAACRAALRPGGVLGVWSAGPADTPWKDRLARAGFVAELQHVTARPGGGARHALFFGTLPGGTGPRPGGAGPRPGGTGPRPGGAGPRPGGAGPRRAGPSAPRRGRPG